jgi:glucokinase
VASPSAVAVVAIDIGGTNTRVALVYPQPGAPRFENVQAFPTEEAYAAQIQRLASAIADARVRAEARGVMVAGVGVSFGGRMAQDGASVAIAPNLRSYERQLLTKDLAVTGMPVRAAHDALCGLLGETRFGALAGRERCAYLTISTGLGAAIHLASAGAPGVYTSIEMGHQLLDLATRRCLCGQTGCLETYVSGRQLALYYGAPLEELVDPAIWETLAEKLSLGLVNLAQLTRVEVVAVGGAIALACPALLAVLHMRLANQLRGMSLEIIPAALGARSPLAGAAALLDTDPATILN